MVSRLQVKASQIGRLLHTLEAKSKADEKITVAGGVKPKSEQTGPPTKKPHYIDPIPPFNANKIRKSPSATVSISSVTTSKEDAKSDEIK